LGINTVKKMRTTQLGLKSILLDSPEHLFWNMFPTHAKNWIKKSQQKSFRLFGLKHDSIFKQLIHEEIRQKIQTLDHFRTQQASRLGLLMKVTPFTAVINREDLLKTVSIESKLCLASMKNILTPLLSVDNIITSHFKVQDTIGKKKKYDFIVLFESFILYYRLDSSICSV
jgi:nuclear-control-of-ATPase protein 2